MSSDLSSSDSSDDGLLDESFATIAVKAGAGSGGGGGGGGGAGRSPRSPRKKRRRDGSIGSAGSVGGELSPSGTPPDTPDSVGHSSFRLGRRRSSLSAHPDNDTGAGAGGEDDMMEQMLKQQRADMSRKKKADREFAKTKALLDDGDDDDDDDDDGGGGGGGGGGGSGGGGAGGGTGGSDSGHGGTGVAGGAADASPCLSSAAAAAAPSPSPPPGSAAGSAAEAAAAAAAAAVGELTSRAVSSPFPHWPRPLPQPLPPPPLPPQERQQQQTPRAAAALRKVYSAIKSVAGAATGQQQQRRRPRGAAASAAGTAAAAAAAGGPDSCEELLELLQTLLLPRLLLDGRARCPADVARWLLSLAALHPSPPVVRAALRNCLALFGRCGGGSSGGGVAAAAAAGASADAGAADAGSLEVLDATLVMAECGGGLEAFAEALPDAAPRPEWRPSLGFFWACFEAYGAEPPPHNQAGGHGGDSGGGGGGGGCDGGCDERGGSLGDSAPPQALRPFPLRSCRAVLSLLLVCARGGFLATVARPREELPSLLAFLSRLLLLPRVGGDTALAASCASAVLDRFVEEGGAGAAGQGVGGGGGGDGAAVAAASAAPARWPQHALDGCRRLMLGGVGDEDGGGVGGGRGSSGGAAHVGVPGISAPPLLWVPIAQRMPLTPRAQYIVGVLSTDLLRRLPLLPRCQDWRQLGAWEEDQGYAEEYGSEDEGDGEGGGDCGGAGASTNAGAGGGGGGAAAAAAVALDPLAPAATAAPLDFKRLEAPLRTLRNCARGIKRYELKKGGYSRSFFRGLLLWLELADLAIQGMVARPRHAAAAAQGGGGAASPRQMALWQDVLTGLRTSLTMGMAEEIQHVMELVALLLAKYEPHFPTPASERVKKKQQTIGNFFGS
jgi:hypothetical protein